jgi:hypothetical protein
MAFVKLIEWLGKSKMNYDVVQRAWKIH